MCVYTSMQIYVHINFQKACSHAIWKLQTFFWRRYKIQETLHMEQWCLSPLQSKHLRTSHSSPNGHQLPPSHFPESHWRSEISSLSKVTLILGKAGSHRVPYLGWRVAESPVWSDVSPKTLQDKWCMSGRCRDEDANHHLPRTAAFWVVRIISVEECSSLM